jgi:hypothetical protein
LNIYICQGRNVCKPALKSQRLSRNRSSPLRENDQVVADCQRLAAFRDKDVGFVIIADVTGYIDHRPEEGIAPKLVLDHALRSRQQRDDEDHVQQRRVIGDDQVPAAVCELLRTDHFKADHPQRLQHADV